MPIKDYLNLNKVSKNSALIPVVGGCKSYDLPFKPQDVNVTFIFVRDKETNEWLDLISTEGYIVDVKLILEETFDDSKYSEIYVREVVTAPTEIVDYTTIRALTIEQLKLDQQNAVSYLKYFYDLAESRMMKFNVETDDKEKLIFPEPANNQGYVWSDEYGWRVYDFFKWQEEFETIKQELHDLVLAQLMEDLVAIEASLKTIVETYAKEKLDVYISDVVKPDITSYVDNELYRINKLFETLVDEVFSIRGEIPKKADWHKLIDGLWTVTDFQAGQFVNAPKDVLDEENSGYVQMFTDKTTGNKILRYLAGPTMFFTMRRAGEWTEYSRISGEQTGTNFKISQPNHGFVLSPVRLAKINDESHLWVGATARVGADGLATRIDDDTFLLNVSGEIVVPVGAVDDKGEPLVDDEYYFTSETKAGFVQRELPFRYHQSIVQIAYTTERGKVGDVKITPVFDQTPTFVDAETGDKLPILFKSDMHELEYPEITATIDKTVIGAINETKEKTDKASEDATKAQETADLKVNKAGDTMTGSLKISNPEGAFSISHKESGLTLLESSDNTEAGSYIGGTATQWYDDWVGQGVWRGESTTIDAWGVVANGNRRVAYSFATGTFSVDGALVTGGGIALPYDSRINFNSTNTGFGWVVGEASGDGGLYFTRTSSGTADSDNMVILPEEVRVNKPFSVNSTLKSYGACYVGAHDELGSVPAITLAIGDTDTGFNWESDGVMQIWANGVNVGYWTGGSFHHSGEIIAGGNVIAYSDIKLKKDLVKIPDALDKVLELNGYTYTRIDSGEKQTGVVAQEVQKVLPELITSTKDSEGVETLGVAYGNMAGLFIEAIKELKAEIEELKSKVGC